MKILKRKTLAALLALSLLASLLPIGAQPALAAENAPQTLYVGGTIISTGYWTSSDDGTTWARQENQPEGNNYIYYDGQGNLKLHNVTIQGADNTGSPSYGAGIYALCSQGQSVALTIELIGTNTITGYYGIFLNAEINASSYGTDASLTITGESNGSLEVSGSYHGIYVKSGTGNASLNIKNVAVTSSTNSNYNAGVYVHSGANATDSPNISLSVDGGSLTASGGESSDGIWFYVGSSQASKATTSLTVSENAIVDAKTGGIKASDPNLNNLSDRIVVGSGTGTNGGIVFNGNTGTVYGDVELQEDLEIGEGESLTLASGASLNTNGKLTVDGGTLTGEVTGTVIYKVTDVSLDKTELALTEGGSETLTAIITPSNATNQNVAWSSEDTDVISVAVDQTDNTKATVKALKEGSATIIATTADGNKTATCAVTVTAKTYSLSVDKSTLNFGSITEGDALPAAQEVTITNTGNQTVTLVQPTANNFEIGALSPTELEPNASATFTIQPKDNLSRGSYSEQITISGNDGASATLTATFTVKEPPYTGKYSYELTTSVGDHGSLTVDRYATEGEKVTITVTPDEAYKLDDLSVTAGGKEVALTAGGDGTFSFTMPSADVKISATFAEDPDWTEPEEPASDVSDIFLDIARDAWYKDAVQYAYDNGLMTGVSATEFAPEATTTRAMIVSMLARLEGVQHSEAAGFNDVAANDWYATAVNWAAASGITSGTGDGNFSPNTAITREQLAAILMNYAQYKGQDVSARATLDTYSDAAAISSWANEVMSWAVAEGLISGVTADTLQPQGAATRAQVAAILQRFLSE